VKADSGEGRSGRSTWQCSEDRGARRGEREREAFGVELADEIGEREGGARGHGKLWRGGGTVGGK
jgi:hypothetical protein